MITTHKVTRGAMRWVMVPTPMWTRH